MGENRGIYKFMVKTSWLVPVIQSSFGYWLNNGIHMISWFESYCKEEVLSFLHSCQLVDLLLWGFVGGLERAPKVIFSIASSAPTTSFPSAWLNKDLCIPLFPFFRFNFGWSFQRHSIMCLSLLPWMQWFLFENLKDVRQCWKPAAWTVLFWMLHCFPPFRVSCSWLQWRWPYSWHHRDLLSHKIPTLDVKSSQEMSARPHRFPTKCSAKWFVDEIPRYNLVHSVPFSGWSTTIHTAAPFHT